MSLVSEFTHSELHHIRQMLTQRYGQDVEIELADCELILDKNSGQATPFPTVFWYARSANFVVFKLGAFQYRAQFFYTPHDRYGTAIEQYSNVDECITALLHTQETHERTRRADNSSELSQAK